MAVWTQEGAWGISTGSISTRNSARAARPACWPARTTAIWIPRLPTAKCTRCRAAVDGPSRRTLQQDCFAYYVSLACNHCARPACMEVCPTGAMHRGNFGLVSVDERRCIGCGYCALSCPYHAPKVDRLAGHSAKCDGVRGARARGQGAHLRGGVSRARARFRPHGRIAEAARRLCRPSASARFRRDGPESRGHAARVCGRAGRCGRVSIANLREIV